MKGSTVNALWVCVLVSLLSIVAYSGLSDALSDSGQPPIEIPVLQSMSATPPLLANPVGALALDASSGRPAPEAARNDGPLPANLATYVFLHKTWNEGLSAPTSAGLTMCSE